MKIVKKENGNTLLTDASGNTIKRFPEGAVIELDKDREGEFVRIAYGHQNKHDIYPSTITHTQIEPNAEVAFSGTAQDLLNLLSTSFFFEVVGGSPYVYGDNTTQHFLASNYVAATTVAALTNVLRGYFVTIYNDLEIIDIRVRITSGVAGASIFGMYEVDEAGYPSSKVFESAIFDNSLTAQQSTVVNSQVKAGTYFVCYNSNSTPTFYGFSTLSLHNPALGIQNILSTTPQNTGISVAYAYVGSLPNNFPIGATALGNIAIPSAIFLV